MLNTAEWLDQAAAAAPATTRAKTYESSQKTSRLLEPRLLYLLSLISTL